MDWLNRDSSYVRTLSLPPGDVNRDVFVVPYGGKYDLSKDALWNGFDRPPLPAPITPTLFKGFVAEIQTPDGIKPSTDPSTWNSVLRRWARAPSRIVISRYSYPPNDSIYFSQQSIDSLVNKFLDPTDIGALFPRRSYTAADISVVQSHRFDQSQDSDMVIVYPMAEVNNIAGTGGCSSSRGYCSAGVVDLSVFHGTFSFNGGTAEHELEHAEGNLGHAIQTLTFKQSILTPGGEWPPPNGPVNVILPHLADKKEALILSQPTYTNDTGTGPTNQLRLNDVLGMNFYGN